MKKVFKILLFITDALLIPGAVFCHWLSGRMLMSDNPCVWTLLGGQCLTCGGTRFVHSLLSGRIGEAWHYNELLFIITVLLVLSWVLLHLHLLGHVRWAGRILRILYSIPSLLIALGVMTIFLIIRNWDLLMRIWEWLLSK